MFPGQFSNANQVVRGRGGVESDITVNGINYRLHSFFSSGSFILDKGAQQVERLIVGGGGGGGMVGFALSGASGAGGGGGYVYENDSDIGNIGGVWAARTYPVVVGAGGATDTAGSASSFGFEYAWGGYQGAPAYTTGSWPGSPPSSFGSGGSGAAARFIPSGGGGSSVRTANYGSATCGVTRDGQGYTGGTFQYVIVGNDYLIATAGGGGAGGCGQQASWDSNTKTLASGNGGAAVTTNFTGSNVAYAGGGGGAGSVGNYVSSTNDLVGSYNFVYNQSSETGGNGSGIVTYGGSATGAYTGSNAFSNSGGGGGASASKRNSNTANTTLVANGGQGGSGVVHIRYRKG